MNNNTIRPYEMSVWTLGDSFIATLKAPGVETKGHVEEPRMTLSLDGTEELTFKIPMYYYLEDQYIENPFWYDMQHGLLMVGLRKIKVIFNKGEDIEKVQEFLVVNVEEEHAEDGSLFCNVTASGLAFQELGKKGYNIILSYDEFDAEREKNEEKLRKQAQEEEWTEEQLLEKILETNPVTNINYWCDKIFKDSGWEYSIQMDWSLYDGYALVLLAPLDNEKTHPYVEIGIVNMACLPSYNFNVNIPQNLTEEEINQSLVGSLIIGITHLGWFNQSLNTARSIIPYSSLNDTGKLMVNKKREELGLRRCDRLYEDPYVKYWELDEVNERMFPFSIEHYREKYRIVEGSQSNIYNLSQIISETFEVYCKYKYYYDCNYHIIKKEVIFYNQLLDEYSDIIDLTYAYGATAINRQMDSNDICTKLIVENIDGNEFNNVINIMNAKVNKTGENYILNFDYLHSIGAITEDQYQRVQKYEYAMRHYNDLIKPYNSELNLLAEEINELKSNITLYNNSLELSREQISSTISEIKSLTKNETGTLEYKGTVYLYLDESKKYYYIDISNKGVIESTIKLYVIIENSLSENFNIEISNNNYSVIKDENDNITQIKLLKGNIDQGFVGLEYSYRPQLYSENVLNTFLKKMIQTQQKLEVSEAQLEFLQEQYDDTEERYNTLLERKNKEISNFTKLMGPALREGIWKPDSYSNYTEQQIIRTRFGLPYVEDSNEQYKSYWDTISFDGEQKNYYEIGVNQEKVYYPYIVLSSNYLGINDKVRKYFEKENEHNLYFRYSETVAESISFTVNYETFIIYTTIVLNGENKTFSEHFTNSSEEAVKDKIRKDILLYGLQKKTGETYDNLESYSEQERIDVAKQIGLSYKEFKYFMLGSTMIPAFLADENNENIYSVLLLTGTEKLSDEEVNKIIQIANNTETRQLGELSITTEESSDFIDYTSLNYNSVDDIDSILSYIDYSNITAHQEFTPIIEENIVVNAGNSQLHSVYPRIMFPDFSLNTSNIDISIYSNNFVNNLNKINQYEDYSLLSRSNGYYITLKPERILESGYINSQITVRCEISNSETSVYLDAVEIVKNNSCPQVSYSVTLSTLNKNILSSAYLLLGKIAHINDYELKFENVLGYISSIELNLNNPWEDQIEVQNYKTKFADLFTKIISSTQQIQNNIALYNRAAGAFNSYGLINSNVLQESFKSAANFTFDINKGKLTIDTTEGIMAESESGMVMMTGGGIYCATEKNSNGTWRWHTGIVPSGINASVIKSGQLDTNLIRIFAGDNLRFQMNGEGIFAFKPNKDNTPNENEYVVYNSSGLFMVKRNMKYYYDENNNLLINSSTGELTAQKGDINRVSISWDGLILRNDNNKQVFYADNDGNLTLSGTIQASAGTIGGWNIDSNSLTTSYNVGGFAGLASGPMLNGLNAVDHTSNNDLYKVFWAGGNTVDGESRFYVDSHGDMFANSLVVNESLVIGNHLTLNGVPLELVLPEVANAESGIKITPLDGTVFNVLSDGNPMVDSLQFTVTTHDLDLFNDDARGRIRFYLTYEMPPEESELIPNWEIDNNIVFTLNNTKCLTFTIDYDRIENNKDLYVKVQYTVLSEEANEIIEEVYEDIVHLTTMELSAILAVQLFSYRGLTVNNNESIDQLTLTAKVYYNGREVENPTSRYYFEWLRKMGNDTEPIFINEVYINSDKINVDYNKYSDRSNTFICNIYDLVEYNELNNSGE